MIEYEVILGGSGKWKCVSTEGHFQSARRVQIAAGRVPRRLTCAEAAPVIRRQILRIVSGEVFDKITLGGGSLVDIGFDEKIQAVAERAWEDKYQPR